MEEDGVAGFEGPTEDFVLVRIVVDVGQVFEGSLRKPFGFIVHERARHEPAFAVGTCNEAQTGFFRYRIDRQPHADVLEAVDIVIGLVLVPWGFGLGFGLLDQQVIVVEANFV